MSQQLPPAQRGFTLIEIAIVLIIIALLTGGIMKGIALIETSRIQKTSEQIQALGAAWFNYLNRFSQIPGDDNNATARHNAPSGNGDGILQSTEQPLVWQHLRASDMIIGDGTSAPLTPWGNPYQFTYHPSTARHYLCIQNLSGDRALILDTQLDTGTANTGNLTVLGSTNAAFDDTATLCYKL